MALLKVYLDDSGSQTDPNLQDSVLVVGGYVADIHHWKKFEWLWDDVMQGYEVPYLHMKEWWNEDKEIYRSLKDDVERQIHFFGDLIQTIKDTMFCAVSASIRLRDLRAVNAKHGLNLNAFSFGLYACILALREYYPNDELQIVIDKITKPHKHIQIAKDYAETDTYQDLNPQAIPITPIEEPDSFKNILPIQAADFLAWEVRKYGHETVGWLPPLKGTREDFRADYAKWVTENNPRVRKSAFHLNKAVPHIGHIWDEFNISAAHTVRHKTGWD